MKKGFTLVEVLTAIVIIGILAGIAGFSILSLMEKGRGDSNELQEKNLGDSAITYFLSNNSFFKKCPAEFIVDETNFNNIPPENANCVKKVKVQTLIEEGFFKDENHKCNSQAEIFVYNYLVDTSDTGETGEETSGEYRFYVPKGTCQS